MSNEPKLSDQEIIAICKEAFQPFPTAAELQDYDDKIGVAVYPQEATQIIVFKGEPIDPLRYGEKLHELLRAGRRRLRNFGFPPGPWLHDPQ